MARYEGVGIEMKKSVVVGFVHPFGQSSSALREDLRLVMGFVNELKQSDTTSGRVRYGTKIILKAM